MLYMFDISDDGLYRSKHVVFFTSNIVAETDASQDVESIYNDYIIQDQFHLGLTAWVIFVTNNYNKFVKSINIALNLIKY